jgi:HPt (histidine-containing phosphotransfer) domain-containing protein
MSSSDPPPASGDAPQRSSPAILDTHDGLERVMGNRVLYARMLKRFHTEYLTFPTTLQDLLANGETERAQRLAHTLKGAAGMIGALALHVQAGVLEIAIAGASESHTEEFAKLERELGAAFDALLAALDGPFAPGG